MVDRLPTKATCDVNSLPMNRSDRVTRGAFVGGVAGLPTASGLNDCSAARNQPAASKLDHVVEEGTRATHQVLALI